MVCYVLGCGLWWWFGVNGGNWHMLIVHNCGIVCVIIEIVREKWKKCEIWKIGYLDRLWYVMWWLGVVMMFEVNDGGHVVLIMRDGVILCVIVKIMRNHEKSAKWRKLIILRVDGMVYDGIGIECVSLCDFVCISGLLCLYVM